MQPPTFIGENNRKESQGKNHIHTCPSTKHTDHDSEHATESPREHKIKKTGFQLKNIENVEKYKLFNMLNDKIMTPDCYDCLLYDSVKGRRN